MGDNFKQCNSCENIIKINNKTNIFITNKTNLEVCKFSKYSTAFKKEAISRGLNCLDVLNNNNNKIHNSKNQQIDTPFKLFLCKFNDTVGSFNKNYMLKWISVDQKHLFQKNLSTYLNVNKSEYLKKENYLGKIKIDNNKEIIWTYFFNSPEARKPNGVRPPHSTFTKKYTLRKQGNKTEYGFKYRTYLDIFFMKKLTKPILSASGFCTLEPW